MKIKLQQQYIAQEVLETKRNKILKKNKNLKKKGKSKTKTKLIKKHLVGHMLDLKPTRPIINKSGPNLSRTKGLSSHSKIGQTFYLL